MKSTFNICFYAKKDKQKAGGAYPPFSPVLQWTVWQAVLILNWTCCLKFGTVRLARLSDARRKPDVSTVC